MCLCVWMSACGKTERSNTAGDGDEASATATIDDHHAATEAAADSGRQSASRPIDDAPHTVPSTQPPVISPVATEAQPPRTQPPAVLPPAALGEGRRDTESDNGEHGGGSGAANSRTRCRGLDADYRWTGRRQASQWVPGLYPGGRTERRVAALTFDDGPDDDTTGALLDILAAAQVPATFFVVGRILDSDSHPLIHRMHDEGHEIGNHTFRHARQFDRVMGVNSAHWVLAEVELCEIAINLALHTETTRDFRRARGDVFGDLHWDTSPEDTVAAYPEIRDRYELWLADRALNPRRSAYFRPPGGAPFYGGSDYAPAIHNQWGDAMERSGMLQVLWHRDTRDWELARRNDEDEVFKLTLARLLEAIHQGGIVLMHDRSNPEIVRAALARAAEWDDVQFVTLEHFVRQEFDCSLEDLQRELSAVAAVAPPLGPLVVEPEAVSPTD